MYIKSIFLPAEGSCDWNRCRVLHQEPSEFVRQNLKWFLFTSRLSREAWISFLQETSESVPEVCGISVQEESDSQVLNHRAWPWEEIWWTTDLKKSEAGHTCRWLKNKTSMCSLQAQDSPPQPWYRGRRSWLWALARLKRSPWLWAPSNRRSTNKTRPSSLTCNAHRHSLC